MNANTRRLVTSLAGTALAASALASTGPAAFAGKPGGGGTTTQPLILDPGVTANAETRTADLNANFTVPVGARQVKKITCTYDGVPLADCGSVETATKSSTRYVVELSHEEVFPVTHTLSVTVTTTKATYSGASTFETFWGEDGVVHIHQIEL